MRRGTPSNPVRAVLFSTLYPNSALPRAGVFVETRLRELSKSGRVVAKVVAPVRWSPVHSERFGVYAQMAAAPEREVLNGLDVLHPRFLTIPKLGMNVAPFLLALGAAKAFRQLRREGFDFEVIDAHYYYPDGVAAAILSRLFDRPLAITARGSDVNQISSYAWPRRLMKWSAERASASIGVSSALVAKMRELGFDETKLHTMRNGVDANLFRPTADHAATRASLGLPAAPEVPVVLTVGNLKQHKGQHLVIEAMPEVLKAFPQAQLVVLGDGPEDGALRALAEARRLGGAVRFVGTMTQEQLARWYGAANVLVLASASEGWPNVLLEAMACGTPVVASDVGGVREIVRDARVGHVLPERTAGAIARGVCEMLQGRLDRGAIRDYASQYSWDSTSEAQADLFERLVGRAETRRSGLDDGNRQLQEEL